MTSIRNRLLAIECTLLRPTDLIVFVSNTIANNGVQPFRLVAFGCITSCSAKEVLVEIH